jgi:hypothetical protein
VLSLPQTWGRQNPCWFISLSLLPLALYTVDTLKSCSTTNENLVGIYLLPITVIFIICEIKPFCLCLALNDTDCASVPCWTQIIS